MKKMSLLLTVVTALLIAIPASAQLNVGVIGGLNLANLSVDPDQGLDLSNRTGFGVGGVLSLGLGETLALQLEPMYLQKGTTDKGGGQESKIELGYIEVPAMIKFPFGSGDTKPYAIAGPTIGWLLSAEVDGEDVKDNVKNIDFGIAFGGGVSVPMGNKTFFVEGRYSLGLSDIDEDEDDKVETKGIQIMAGITFPLGGDSYTYKGQ